MEYVRVRTSMYESFGASRTLESTIPVHRHRFRRQNDAKDLRSADEDQVAEIVVPVHRWNEEPCAVENWYFSRQAPSLRGYPGDPFGKQNRHPLSHRLPLGIPESRARNCLP